MPRHNGSSTSSNDSMPYGAAASASAATVSDVIHSAAHEDGNLLHDLDASVARLPALLRHAHRLEEWQQRGDAERRRDDRERARCRVAYVLVDVVDVGPHRRNHAREAGRLGQVGDDLAALNARVVVLVDEQRLDDDQDLMHVRPHKVVELVHDPVNDLDEQVALLVLQRRLHQQRQHLVEKRPRAQVARLVGKLPQRRLALRRRAVLDLEQQLHDLALLGLLHTQLRLVHVLEQLTEVLHVLRLHLRQALGRERHVLRGAARRQVEGRASLGDRRWEGVWEEQICCTSPTAHQKSRACMFRLSSSGPVIHPSTST
eukprot:78823-Chlamydomonas_euryale.AAC.18